MQMGIFHTLSGGTELNLPLKIFYSLFKLYINIHHILHHLARVDYRAVISSSKMISNRFQRIFRKVLSQVHT